MKTENQYTGGVPCEGRKGVSVWLADDAVSFCGHVGRGVNGQNTVEFCQLKHRTSCFTTEYPNFHAECWRVWTQTTVCLLLDLGDRPVFKDFFSGCVGGRGEWQGHCKTEKAEGLAKVPWSQNLGPAP